MKAYIFILVCLLVVTYSVPTQDQVHITNPHYTDHRWYSGYLNFTAGQFHYVFFESQRDPDNDPLVLWLNGGPGCSSLIGMVYENGPFVFKPNTSKFQPNQNAWNKKANLLYIQSPQGVGFSKGINQSLPLLNDATVAEYNLKALLAFFIKFPNMKKNDFYMTGESYAGIYVPYLAYQIIKNNKLPSEKEHIIRLKGIMVGNACTDPDQCYTPGNGMSLFQYQFLYKHAYIGEKQYDQMRAVCVLGYHSEVCQKIRAKMDADFTATRTSILNIYAPCYNQTLNGTQRKYRQSGRYSDVDEGSCDDSLGGSVWFNDPLNQEQLHVAFSHWQECSEDVANKYVMFANASYWLYPLLMKENLKIWVFSGDVDADVPITGTIRWLEKAREQFELPVLEPWRQWWVRGLHKHQDQVGGMVWKLRGITFASVKGAGHMVARDQRKSAYVLLDHFLSGIDLPQKDQADQ